MKRGRSKKAVEKEEREDEKRFQAAQKRKKSYISSDSEATQPDSESTLSTQPVFSQGSQSFVDSQLGIDQSVESWIDSQIPGLDQSIDTQYDFMGPLPKPIPEPELSSQFPSTSDSSQWITETRPPSTTPRFLKSGQALDVVKEAIRKQKEAKKKQETEKERKKRRKEEAAIKKGKKAKSIITKEPSEAEKRDAAIARERALADWEVLADREDYEMEDQGVGKEPPRPLTREELERQPWRSRADARPPQRREEEENVFSFGPAIFKQRAEVLSDESVDEDEVEEVTDFHFIEELAREKLLSPEFSAFDDSQRRVIATWTDLRKDIMLIVYNAPTDEEIVLTKQMGLATLKSDEEGFDLKDYPEIVEYHRVLRELANEEEDIFIKWMSFHYNHMYSPDEGYITKPDVSYYLFQDEDRWSRIDQIKKRLSKEETDKWQSDYDKNRKIFDFPLLSDYFILLSSTLTPANVREFQRADPSDLNDKYDALYESDDRLLIDPIFFSYVWMFMSTKERDILVWFNLIKPPLYLEKPKTHKTKEPSSQDTGADAAPSMFIIFPQFHISYS